MLIAIASIERNSIPVCQTKFSFILVCVDGPGSSISFNPADESITKNQGQSLGPIVCSAECNPPCQFYWIKPDGTVVDGSNLDIPILSKNDHGTFTCYTGNGYGNNGTKNLQLTVNCRCLILKFDLTIVSRIINYQHFGQWPYNKNNYQVNAIKCTNGTNAEYTITCIEAMRGFFLNNTFQSWPFSLLQLIFNVSHTVSQCRI
jgi:hypothetical protein